METREQIIKDFKGIYARMGYLASDRPGMKNIMSNGSFDIIDLGEVADDYIADEIAAGRMEPERMGMSEFNYTVGSLYIQRLHDDAPSRLVGGKYIYDTTVKVLEVNENGSAILLIDTYPCMFDNNGVREDGEAFLMEHNS